ncbi:MAG: fumarylacetoacetate hydrolase family protein [Proteobacteria bacterium]|nr:fumarylacetoacetate hydrolase family protein [Pseudomonadota bacterium]
MTPPDLATAARELCNNRIRPVEMAPLPESLRPRDEPEAYRLQELLHQQLTNSGFGQRAGFKVGCTTKVMQTFMEIDHPCSGGVMSETVYKEYARCSYSGFARIGVEAEIAVRLGADLPARDTPYRREDVAAAVESCMASIELVDERYDDFRRFDIETLVADDFFNAGCVLGPECRDWRALDLGKIGGRMRADGREIGTGVGADILGHPFEALAWLANNRAEQGLGLTSGEFITLGSIVQTHWVSPGERINVEIEGLGSASVEFLASTAEVD